MSFSGNVREEIAGIIPGGRHCKIASLAAILDQYGEFRVSRGRKCELYVAHDNEEAVRKSFTLLSKLVNINSVSSCNFGEGEEFSRGMLRVDLDQEEVQELAGMLRQLNEDGTPKTGSIGVSSVLLKRDCCRRSYLRETFLCIGSMSDPSKDYHLEFDCGTMEQAEQLQKVLESFGIEARMTRRKRLFLVYLKDGATIVDVLKLIGASVSAMEMENLRIVKDIRNSVNRRVNCETANIGKTISASHRQIEDIRYLEECGILKTLPENLQAMAELRLTYPDLPLKELGLMANPAVGKSGVNHRLRRLSDCAQKHRETNGNISTRSV